MTNRYYLSSYDVDTDEQVESIETTPRVYEVVKATLGAKFNPYQDQYVITPSICHQLEICDSFRIPSNPKVEWFLEIYSS
jgi:hypothetical protein